MGIIGGRRVAITEGSRTAVGVWPGSESGGRVLSVSTHPMQALHAVEVLCRGGVHVEL